MSGALRTVVLAALAIAGFVLQGCGYSTGLRAADRIRTVGITVFGNQTLERDLERRFQDEISRAVRSLTDVPIQPPARAEFLVRGTVTDFRRRGGIRSPENRLLETGVYVEIEAALIDRASDRALGPPRRAGVWVGYVVGDPHGEDQALDRAIRHVAEEIVLVLFSPLE